MFCIKCGNKNEDNAKFCIRCGAPLETHDLQSQKINNNVPRNVRPGSDDNTKKKPSNKKIPIVIVSVVIVILIVLLVIIGFLVFGDNIGSDESNAELTSEFTSESDYTTTTTEITTESETEYETYNYEENFDEPTYAQSANNNTEYEGSESDVFSSVRNMLNEFYSYAWVNTTNEHDSSYVSKYTVPNSRAYQKFGVEYWQEKPNVRFNSIHDLNLVSLQEKDDGSYDAYVSYVFEVHYTDTGMDERHTELAVDNIVYQDGKFLVKGHTWKGLLPAGTEADISDFN